jgi:hypothetical protein
MTIIGRVLMKRTLTAAAILAATIGMVGLAQAQTVQAPAYGTAQRYESPGKPTAGQQAAPSAFTSPAVPSNSNPYWRYQPQQPVTGPVQ